MRFAGRTVFVTGAAKGIGLEAARRFGAEGADVCLFDRDTDALETALADVLTCGESSAVAHVGDVRSRAQVEAAVAACERELGSIDVLLNHAGIGPSTHVLEMTDDEWDEVIDINLTGVFVVAQTVAAAMASRKHGVIINMSSSGGIATEPGHSHYAASKAGVLALTRAMAGDLAPNGIRVFAICPGAIDTFAFGNVETQRIYEARIAAGRSGTAAEVASVYLYLASDETRMLTGTTFIVDGGLLAWE